MYYHFFTQLDSISRELNTQIPSSVAEIVAIVKCGGDKGNPRVCVVVQDPGLATMKAQQQQASDATAQEQKP